MTETHLDIDAYMSRFEAALKRYRLPEQAEITADVRSHIAEALACGKSLEAVLESLGPAGALARAYAAELLLQSPTVRPAGAVGRVLRGIRRAALVIAIVAASGFVTLVVVIVLGGFGVSLASAGILFLLIGVMEAGGVHLQGAELGPLSPWAAIAISPLVFAVGWALLWLLWRYVRLTARLLRKAPQSDRSPPLARA